MFVLVGIDILPVGASVRPLQYGKKTSIGMPVPTEIATESISRQIRVESNPIPVKKTITEFQPHKKRNSHLTLIQPLYAKKFFCYQI